MADPTSGASGLAGSRTEPSGAAPPGSGGSEIVRRIEGLATPQGPEAPPDPDATGVPTPAPAGTGDPWQTRASGPADAAPATQLTLSSAGRTDDGSAGAAGQGGGTRLGRFRIIRQLGRGGFGTVFLAFDPILCREVALKVPRLEGSWDPLLRQRFLREAQAAAGLDHPNLVPVYEAGEADGAVFIVSAYCKGPSLSAWLKARQCPLPPARAAALVASLADAVAYIHARQVLHRDIKPGNVLLDPTAGGAAADRADEPPGFVARLTDFGLAKILDEEGAATTSGVVAGTPAYMAPEQAQSARSVGPAADVYALGALLYDVLTGQPPFRAPTVLETLRQVREEEPVPPRRRRPDVPRDLEAICLKCLEKSPARRYATAADLADDLRRFGDDRPVRARPVRAWERAWKWARRRPALAGLVAVSTLALLGLGVAGWQYADQQRRHQEAARREQDGRRAEGQDLIERGLAARAQREPGAAREWFARAVEVLGRDPALLDRDPALAALRAKAAGHRADADAEFRRQEAEAQAASKHRDFRKRRDEALFHSTLATGDGRTAHLQATRQAAGAALALFGARDGPPAVDPPLRPHAADIRDDCYELLLVLAEAQAEPDARAGGLRDALRTLDVAGAFGVETRALHLRRARYLRGLGRPDEAEREARLARGRPVERAFDYFLVGDEHYRVDEVGEAVQNFEAALQRQPDLFWARYFLAVCYLREDRPGEARAVLTACLVQHPDVVWVYLMRGFALGQLGDYEAAEADFREAGRLEAQAPSAEVRYVLHANRGVMRVGRGRFAEGIADLGRALAEKEGDHAAHVTLAFAHQLYNGRLVAGCMAGLATAVGAVPTPALFTPGAWAPDRGLAGLLAANDRAAEGHLRRAAALTPGEPAPYRYLAELYRRRGDLDGALRAVADAAARAQARGDAVGRAKDLAERGRILARRGRYRDAVAAYDAALGANADDADAHLGRAEALLQLREPDADRQAAGSADQYFLVHGPPSARAHQVRGTARYRLGRHPEAVDDFTRALALEPDHPPTLAARGLAYLAADAPQLALADLGRALARGETSAEAYIARGYAHARLGRYAAAVADAQEAVRCQPGSLPVHYDAARIVAQAAAPAPGARRDTAERARRQRQALTLLTRATLGLPAARRRQFWYERVRRDPALEPLRDTAGYRLLEAAATQAEARGP